MTVDTGRGKVLPFVRAAGVAIDAADARPPFALRHMLGLWAIGTLLHLTAIGRYGWFRDELYYVSCAKRLAWGYVDQPPLSIALLAAWRLIVHDSLIGMRVIPLLAHLATIGLTMKLAQRFRARYFGQSLAGVAALASLVYLGIDHYYSMNALDVVFWALAAITLIRALDRERMIDWVWLGVVVGLGLLNKLSMIWCAGGLALGALASGRRRVLATPGPWFAAAIAAAIFEPHAMWQIKNGWPTLEFMRNATGRKMVAVSVIGFSLNQLLSMNPLSAPIWLAGLVRGIRERAGDAGRVVAIQYVAVFVLLMVAGKARNEYLTPAYPALLAMGATSIEEFTARPERAWMRVAARALPLLAMLVLLPLALPVMSVPAFVQYQAALGRKPATEEHHVMGSLPQHYADMFGWPEMADSVAKAAALLTPDERAQAIVVVGNYGEAGALELFGHGRIPTIACQHNNWYLWGPPAWNGRVGIFVGRDSAEVAGECDSVRVVGVAGHSLAMPYEQHLKIVIGRNFRPNLAEAWARGKDYD